MKFLAILFLTFQVAITYVTNLYFENATSFNYHFSRLFQHFKDNLIWTKFGP